MYTKILYPVNPCSFVIIRGNELCQIYLITGAPHGVNPSSINLLDVCLYMGRIYAFLVKYQSDGVFLFNEKYVNHSHVYKL